MLELAFIVLFQAAAGPVQSADPSAQAQTSDATAAAPAQPAQPAQQQPQRRCRNQAVTGSHLPVRVCSSRGQDAAMERDARESVDRAQQQMPLNSN